GAAAGPVAFPSSGLATPIVTPAAPAWAAAFDSFASWLNTPAGRGALGQDPYLISLSNIHPEARRIAVGPLAEALPEALLPKVAGMARLASAERAEVLGELYRARAQAAPAASRAALAAWRAAAPAASHADLVELRALSEQLKALAVYGPEVRNAFRSSKRAYTERSLAS